MAAHYPKDTDMTVTTTSISEQFLIDSAPELDYTAMFIDRATTLKPHQMDVLALVMAATNITDAFATLPRILALGEKGTGKSEVLEIADMLAHNTYLGAAKQMTEPGIRSLFKMGAGDTMTLCADEISKMLGADGTKGETHPLYSLLLTGYKRKTATSVREKNGVPEIVPTFGVVFASGIGKGAPDELRDRSIIIKTEKLADDNPKLAEILDLSDPAVMSKAEQARKALRSWARTIKDDAEKNMRVVRGLHPKLGGRRAEIWGPLFAIAMEAGGDWLQRCAVAFERIQLGNTEPEITSADRVLLDYYEYASANGLDRVRSRDFWLYVKGLGRMEYSEYATAQGFGRNLASEALGDTTAFRMDGEVVKGWHGMEHKMIMRRALRLMERIEEASNITLNDISEEIANPDTDF